MNSQLLQWSSNVITENLRSESVPFGWSRSWAIRKQANDYSSAVGENLGLTGSTPPRFTPVG